LRRKASDSSAKSVALKPIAKKSLHYTRKTAHESKPGHGAESQSDYDPASTQLNFIVESIAWMFGLAEYSRRLFFQ